MSVLDHPKPKMPEPVELRNSALARRFVLEGILLQSIQPPAAEAVPAVLDWYLEAAVEGFPLPPIGVVADVGHLVFGQELPAEHAALPEDQNPSSSGSVHWPRALLRQYEDLFLGKLYGDRSFDRGVDGLRRYSDRRDRAKGLAFLIEQLGRRAGYRGVHFSPAVIRELQRSGGADLLKQAHSSLSEHGPLRLDELENPPLSVDEDLRTTLMEFLYQDLIRHTRNMDDVLGAEDVFELEHGTAIAGFGQRLALRQVLEAATELEAGVPQQPPRPLKRRQQVATQILDEDTYPIGGFSSISNRGSIESLLHSQLAYMEKAERPDMFDIKFLRDELLYYSRDENQFLRRRRSFVFALYPDLTAARLKDPILPWQRIVLLLGLFVVAVRRLMEWLSEDALLFDFVFLKPSGKKRKESPPLTDERELLEMLFREQIANNTVQLTDVDNLNDFKLHCKEHARRSLCHCTLLSTKDGTLELENAYLSRLQLDAAVPAVTIEDGDGTPLEGEAPLEIWKAALGRLLESWVTD